LLNISIGGKEAANISHLICHTLCVPEKIALEANQKIKFDGIPNNIIAYSGLFFHDSHMN
jgi:hypothetical protein